MKPRDKAFTEMYEFVKYVEGSHKDPEDDWFPALILMQGDEPLFTAIPPPIMDSEQRKEVLVAAVSALILREKPSGMAFMSSVWIRKILKKPGMNLDEYPEGIAPSEAEDRIEAVVIHAMDAETDRSGMAEIERFPDKAPVLKDFEEWDSGAMGRFVVPWQDALKRAAR